MENTKLLHNNLISLILKHGEIQDKKHGKWVKYSLPNNQFLQLDSWNKAITLKKGSGEYDYWNGFKGIDVVYFGLHFGGFETRVAPQVYLSAISCIKPNNPPQ